MGCDIHTTTEVRTPSGWQAVLIDKPIFDWRSYRIYGFLANVRNYSEVPAQWPDRPWPEDASAGALEMRERWNGDAHSPSFVTLAELIAFNYDQPVEDRRITVQTGPNSWDGGATAKPGGGKMTTFRQFLDGAYFTELDRLKTLGKPDDVRVLFFFDN